MYDFEEEAKKVIGLRDTLVKHAEDAKLLTMDAADLPLSLAQFQQRYKRFVVEKRLQKDRDTTREKLQMAKHGRYDLLSDDFLSEKAEEEDNDKLRAAFDLTGVQSKLVLQVEAVGGGNVTTPSAAMTSGQGASTGGNEGQSASTGTSGDTAPSSASTQPPVVATSSFTQADQPMYGDDDCMIIREAPATKVISLPSSPTPSHVTQTSTQSPPQQPQYSDHAPDGEAKEDDEDEQDEQDEQDEDGDQPPKKKRLSKKQRERRKQLQQQQLMLQYQLRQQLMGQMNAGTYDPKQQPPLPKQPPPPTPVTGQQQTQAPSGQPATGQQQYPFPFPPFNPGYNFNMPGMPPMPPLPPGMPPMPFWPNNFPPPPQPQVQQQKQKSKTPDPNDVYGQPSYTDN